MHLGNYRQTHGKTIRQIYVRPFDSDGKTIRQTI